MHIEGPCLTGSHGRLACRGSTCRPTWQPACLPACLPARLPRLPRVSRPTARPGGRFVFGLWSRWPRCPTCSSVFQLPRRQSMRQRSPNRTRMSATHAAPPDACRGPRRPPCPLPAGHSTALEPTARQPGARHAGGAGWARQSPCQRRSAEERRIANRERRTVVMPAQLLAIDLFRLYGRSLFRASLLCVAHRPLLKLRCHHERPCCLVPSPRGAPIQVRRLCAAATHSGDALQGWASTRLAWGVPRPIQLLCQ